MTPPLLTAISSNGHVHLIIGSNSIASARCAKSLETGANPIVIAPTDAAVHYQLAKQVESGAVKRIARDFEDGDLSTLGREDVDFVVNAVFVTSAGKSVNSSHIAQLCRRKRIPINVVDAPNLCTFTLLSTHSDGPLQIGITTSGKGCKLASRIRREIATSLPPRFGETVERLGAIRRRIWEEDHKCHDVEELGADLEDSYATAQRPTFNRLVSDDDLDAARTRRMRWLAQICEYWPLKRLAAITDVDIEVILHAYKSGSESVAPLSSVDLDHRQASKPTVYLAGSGPGSPELLTLATHHAIQTASVVLADKLVPEPVLNLIPRRTPVHIARKFPGNADAAQEELLRLGLEALGKGHTVLRLKQGDPYLYGRGAEEYAFFEGKGYSPVVLPGITSALSAPLFAAIPATHRSVADQVLICTGTGRKGAAPNPPPYVPTQTVVFLMALHRLSSLVEVLTDSKGTEQNSQPWPQETPCAVIERASCPDQRVIRSRLKDICSAIEEAGSRPPGLLVVGQSCDVLKPLQSSVKWTIEEGVVGFDMDRKDMSDLVGRLTGTVLEHKS